jgi:hypothetical protein
MRVLFAPLLPLLSSLAFAAPHTASFSTFSNVTVFIPPSNYTDVSQNPLHISCFFLGFDSLGAVPGAGLTPVFKSLGNWP